MTAPIHLRTRSGHELCTDATARVETSAPEPDDVTCPHCLTLRATFERLRRCPDVVRDLPELED